MSQKITPGTRRLLDDCFLHDKDRLAHNEALALLRERLVPVVERVEVEIAHARGFVLAQEIVAPRNIPAFDNAAVDGYALVHGDLEVDAETWLKVSARIPAGEGSPQPLTPGTAVRIFTGAVTPEGADTVIMQEDAIVEQRDGDTWVQVPAGVKPGINLRHAGEDQAQGDVVLAEGTLLGPFEQAAIASTGLDRVMCYAPLKIALISTGDEIVRPGEDLKQGQVYDANHVLLSSLLEGLNVEVTDLGILADDGTLVKDTLLKAAQDHHLIISSGGASRGEEDHIVATLNEHGTLHAWQLAIKPGRPLAFGQIGDAVFLGLPGNPVAVAICFLLYGRMVCSTLGGAPWREPKRFRVKAGFEMKKKPLRREFLRGWLEQDEGGAWLAQKYARDGSGLISSLVAAGGLIELDEDLQQVNLGDEVGFIPFSEFGIVSS